MAAELAPVRLGLVTFGTVARETDTIRQHKLDETNGIALSVTEFATNEAAKIALQAQALDLIGTGDAKVRILLKEGYRAGILEKWGNDERRGAGLLYNVLVERRRASARRSFSSPIPGRRLPP